jgi:hypothetical protein
MPGAAFLFLVPAVIVTIGLLARANAAITAVAGATIAAILIYPLGTQLYEALGGRLMIAVAILIAIQATLFAPVASRASTATLALLCALGCALVAVSQPAYDDAHPLQLSLAYIQDPLAGSTWNAGSLTPSLSGAAKWTATDPALTPWAMRRSWSAPAEPQSLPPVLLTADRGPTSTVIHVRSQRNATRMLLVFRGDAVGGMRINGTALPPRPERFRERSNGGWKFTMVSASTVFDVDIDIPAASKIDVIAADYTFGLPHGSETIERARTDSPAFPAHDGDVTITRARATF